MTKRKPVVIYRPSQSDRIEVGHPAIVRTTNHPSPYVSNTKEVITTPVIEKFENGEFHTRNSIYRPSFVN